MRIEQIEVEGVQSYRQKTIVYVAGHPLLAAVGPNGSGKSTIVVDALIYAFWGRVRTRTIEEMISIGAPQATVSLNFWIGESLFRVTRTTPRQGKAEGGVYAADDLEPSGWRNLTERGMKEVTEKVVELTGMTYEMATQTWIAEQGAYGKFASAKPAERFALLSSVFDLDSYGSLAKRAKEKLTLIETKLTSVDGQISEVESAKEQLAQATTDSFLATETDDALAASAATATADADSIRADIAGLAVGDPATRAQQAKRTLDALVEGRAQAERSARADLSRAEQDLAQATSRHDQARNAAAATSTRRSMEAEGRASQAREVAARQLAVAEASLAQVRDVGAKLPGKIAERDEFLVRADEAAARASALTDEAATSQATYASLTTEWNGLDKQLSDAYKRVSTLQMSLDDAEHASCFSCGQHLSPADAEALIQSQQRDISAWRERQAECNTEGVAAKEAVAARTREAAAARADEQSARAAAADLSDRIATANQMVSATGEHEDRVAAAKQAVEGAGAGLAAEIASIEAEATSATEQAAAEFATTEQAATGALIAAREAVEKASIASPEEVAARTEHQDLLAIAENAEAAIATQRAALNVRLATAVSHLRGIEQEQARRASAAEQARALEARMEALAAERSKVDHDRRYMSVLSKAFHSGGIPAMLLSSIAEELNEAINLSLEHISRGELAILLTASRETRAGTTENKITVYVDTPEGPRAYESLSGGQKFRVDLAIRTGLTRVITRRTGTPVQTFILDEGWGTLDEPGIRAAVDTLTRLSADFNVLTVSHVDAVRDAFPARIKVDRTTGTSVAEVVAA